MKFKDLALFSIIGVGSYYLITKTNVLKNAASGAGSQVGGAIKDGAEGFFGEMYKLGYDLGWALAEALRNLFPDTPKPSADNKTPSSGGGGVNSGGGAF